MHVSRTPPQQLRLACFALSVLSSGVTETLEWVLPPGVLEDQENTQTVRSLTV